MERAAWVPSWYALDQSLAVGLTGEFSFWRIAPDEALRGGPERLVFYNLTWKPEDVLLGSGTIVAISNPELGDIREVDTRSEPFDYAFHLADGTSLEVNAEEEPGRLYEGSAWSSRIVNDWRLTVEFDSLSELRPAPRPQRGPESQAHRRWWDAADPKARLEAVRALTALGSVKSLERLSELTGGPSALRRLLSDPDWDTRRAAAFALGKLGDDASVEHLRRAAMAERPHHRGVYRRAIRAIRERSKP
jgi:hypothetical protein